MDGVNLVQRCKFEAEKIRTEHFGVCTHAFLLAQAVPQMARRCCQWTPQATILPTESDSLCERQEGKMSAPEAVDFLDIHHPFDGLSVAPSYVTCSVLVDAQ